MNEQIYTLVKKIVDFQIEFYNLVSYPVKAQISREKFTQIAYETLEKNVVVVIQDIEEKLKKVSSAKLNQLGNEIINEINNLKEEEECL